MSETNGRGKSRLDRIEEMIERSEQTVARHEAANAAAHERFEEDDKRLLTSQILMNGALQKTNEALEKAIAAVAETGKNIVKAESTIVALSAKADRFAEGMISLELKMEETTGKLNALIDTVGGIIRKRPE